MGAIDDLLRRIERLEARHPRDPEADLPDQLRTRIRVSRMYQRWVQTGGSEPTLRTPDEEENWAYFELLRKLAEEMHQQKAAGVHHGEPSDSLRADWDAFHDKYPPTGAA